MSLKAQLEAIIYAAETPISLEQIVPLVKESVVAETPGIDGHGYSIPGPRRARRTDRRLLRLQPRH